jgi:protein TonB
MSRLRSLLRLDDKVAAEGRRLKEIGRAPRRWVGPVLLLVAAGLHGAILLLPTLPVEATLPESTSAPSLPLVWRPVPTPALPSHVALKPRAPSTPLASTTPASSSAEAQQPLRAIAIEPVAEPVPELALSNLGVALAAIVPDPDRTPPALELGPSARVAPAAPPQAAPTLLERAAPVYPSAARRLRAEGQVTLKVTVLPDGRVGGVIVEACSRKGLGFEAAAVDAVKRWRYAPAPSDEGPRETIATVQFQQQGGRP